MTSGLLFKKLCPSLLLVVLNAPGRSAFNLVEHLLATFNRPMGGITLPIDTYSTHIRNKKVFDDLLDIKKKNVTFAMSIIQTLWETVQVNSMFINLSIKLN